ncbi:uncharacterized protein GGS25DRAFT_484517 [Hypoxylon fragiforme]|uniref:uncharacterized protein n=1 Tax=Hypoxylon fragiforme TaxID=63214 RepID=UPI0020C629BB|nr:uncharacterized protein GGS25DRAFT_484517 [Hypoxylon fragiforme]KAI2609402.1 hypothetical protein GGS25DRAFT_484517 [Hypoxylon fragiforme]
MAAQMTGEQLAALCYAEPPLAEIHGLARVVEVFLYVLAIISVVIVGLRVYVRGFLNGGKIWGVDDYLAVLGFLPYIPSVVFAIKGTHYGLGTLDVELNMFKQIRAAEYMLYFQVIYYVSSTVTKIAIAFTMLRLFQQKWVRWVIHINWVFMTLTAIGALAFVFARCQPFAANYNPLMGTCLPGNGFIIVSYFGSVVQVVTDWVCAIVPFFVVKDLQMPKRKKISLLAVLMLGVLASIASLIRMPYYKYYDQVAYPNNYFYHAGYIALWSEMECGLGIVACSLPPLRRLFKSFFGSSNRSKPGYSGSADPKKSFNTPLGALTPQGKSRADQGWDRLDDDNSSSQHIVRKTDIYVQSTSHDGRDDPETKRKDGGW